jgi:hypothetical protein
MNVMSRWCVLALAVSLLSPVAGCSDDSMSLGLATEIYTPADAPDPFLGVGFIALSVEGDDLRVAPTTVVPYTPGTPGSAEVDAIPFTSGDAERRVIVEGWTTGADGKPGYLVSRGASVRSSVTDGGSAQNLSILLARINSFFSLTSAVTRTTQVLDVGRIGHTTTTTDTGEIVVAGGRTIPLNSKDGSDPATLSEPTYLASVEVIDEQTNSRVIPTVNKDLDLERAWHTATALHTGQVIFTGGYGSAIVNDLNGPIRSCCQALATVEVYEPDPTRETGALANNISKARYGHTATLVDEETFLILIVGGDADGVGTFELWEPYQGTIAMGDLPDGARRFHTATSLKIDGLEKPVVMISGGESDTATYSTNFIVNMNDGQIVNLPSYAKTGGLGRTRHTAAHVHSVDADSGNTKYNWLYLIGGFNDVAHLNPMSAVDVYDIPSNSFRDDPIPLRLARGSHSTVVLDDGAVLTTGGIGAGEQVLDSIEIIHEYYKIETNWVCCQYGNGQIAAVDPDLCAEQGGFEVEGGCSSSEPQVIAKPTIDLAYSSSLCNLGETCPIVPSMPFSRFGHHAVLSDRGTAVLMGGYGGASLIGDTTSEHAITLYNPN